MYRIRPFTNEEQANQNPDKFTVIIPIASKRKPKPAQGIHDVQLARAVESQFYMILPDLPPITTPEKPKDS